MITFQFPKQQSITCRSAYLNLHRLHINIALFGTTAPSLGAVVVVVAAAAAAGTAAAGSPSLAYSHGTRQHTMRPRLYTVVDLLPQLNENVYQFH